jgi:hypothetical protein
MLKSSLVLISKMTLTSLNSDLGENGVKTLVCVLIRLLMLMEKSSDMTIRL